MRRLVIGLADTFRRIRTALFAEPDHALVRARVASERLVASVRLGVIVFVVVLEFLLYLAGKNSAFSPLLASLPLAYGALLFLLPRHSSAPWIPWLVSATDVSLASLVIAAYPIYGFPLAALNNRVLFDSYFVASSPDDW